MSISEWWGKLSPDVRAELREDPRRPLSADLIIAITNARGAGPAITQWQGKPPSPAHLLDEEVEWIEENGSGPV